MAAPGISSVIPASARIATAFTLGYSFKTVDGESDRRRPLDLEIYRPRDRRRVRHRYAHPLQASRHARDWSSEDALWTVEAESEAVKRFCSFFHVCAGYYNYGERLSPTWEGWIRFKGQIDHPQHWPESRLFWQARRRDLAQGTTAVTLVPSMTDKAARDNASTHADLQWSRFPLKINSPTGAAKSARATSLYDLTRLPAQGHLQQIFFPPRAQSPRKNPRAPAWPSSANSWALTTTWAVPPPTIRGEQRLCLVPDSDMFIMIRRTEASVETDHQALHREGAEAQSRRGTRSRHHHLRHGPQPAHARRRPKSSSTAEDRSGQS